MDINLKNKKDDRDKGKQIFSWVMLNGDIH
jgi:hypothetical protein